MENKQYPGIDILKIVLMVLVVCIHFDPLQGAGMRYLRYPIILCAVPLYFICSSFLFFSKNEIDNRNRLTHFVKRNILLYMSWFIILFIPTLIIRGYFLNGNILSELKRLIIDVILGSTFRNSWFIIALVIGTILVYYLTKHIGNIGTLAIGSFLFICCCFASCYGNVGILGGVQHYPRTIYQSFPVSVIWITCGKIIADRKNRVSRIPTKIMCVCSIISALCMYTEFILLDKCGLILTEAYCFFMIPFCISVFCLVYNLDISIRNVRFWRHWTTVTYCFHTTFAWFVCKVLEKTGISYLFPHSIVVWVIIVLVCTGLTAVLIRLSDYRLFKWIKWAI